MTKNLKIKIKNTQLTEVLKRSITKKKPEKKVKKAEPKKVEDQAVVEEPSPVQPAQKTEPAAAPTTPVDTPAATKKPVPAKSEKPAPKPKVEKSTEKKPEKKSETPPTTDIKDKDRRSKKPRSRSPQARVQEKDPTTSWEEERAHEPPTQGITRKSFSRVIDTSKGAGATPGQDNWQWRKRRQQKARTKRSPIPHEPVKELTISLPITVGELSNQLKVKASVVIQKLFLQGLSITINEAIDDETTIELIGHEFGCKITIDRSHQERLQITTQSIAEEVAKTDPQKLQSRPPIVTVMGHVDHGKTSIIDAFRKSKLTEQEAGAITQHIGAFQVKTSHGKFTVLDTPGHEAFTAIRQRGARVTDIVVLVIAGDEGMKPQTVEALEAAKEAGVPIVVAINKMDKPEFNAETIYRELSEHELLPEAWGGQTATINCSAVTGEGIDSLAEMIALQTEILELKADPKARARGTVLEANIQQGLGISATLLVQNGTLKLNDPIVLAHEYGRIKTMQDERGHALKTAPPSAAVKVTTLSDIPAPGSEFVVVASEREARKITEERIAQKKTQELSSSKGKNIEQMMQHTLAKRDKKILPIVIKADTKSSLEAVISLLRTLPQDKVLINFVASSIGVISESDVELAISANAILMGFHTKIEPHAEKAAQKAGITCLIDDIIYKLVTATTDAMAAKLDPIRVETEKGYAKILTVFKSSHLGSIAGSQIVEGTIHRNHWVKLFRDDKEIWHGQISSLKRHKDDVKEVSKGLECGILLDKPPMLQEGDIIRFYEITQQKQEL